MIKKINFEELDLKGAFKIQPFYATDERGGFVKDYNIDVFKSNGIEHELKEVFYTISKRGVVRATHFQLVKQQAKLVRCDFRCACRLRNLSFYRHQGLVRTFRNRLACALLRSVYADYCGYNENGGNLWQDRRNGTARQLLF